MTELSERRQPVGGGRKQIMLMTAGPLSFVEGRSLQRWTDLDEDGFICDPAQTDKATC